MIKYMDLFVSIKFWNHTLFVNEYSSNAYFSLCKAILLQLQYGSVAEWSKALVLGTSLLGGVGSNPTTAKFLNFSVAQSLLQC